MLDQTPIAALVAAIKKWCPPEQGGANIIADAAFEALPDFQRITEIEAECDQLRQAIGTHCLGLEIPPGSGELLNNNLASHKEAWDKITQIEAENGQLRAYIEKESALTNKIIDERNEIDKKYRDERIKNAELKQRILDLEKAATDTREIEHGTKK